MSTQTNPPHQSGDPVLDPRDQRRARNPHEHELLARLAQDLREDQPQYAKLQQAPLAPNEPWNEEAHAPGLSPEELDRLEREIAGEQRRVRRSLEPDFLPPPPPRQRAKNKAMSESFTGPVVRLTAVAVIASLLVLVFAGKFSLPQSWRDSAIEPLKRIVGLVIGTSQAPAATNPSAAVEMPKLAVEGADAGPRDEIGLGVKLKGTAEGALVFVSGLAAGTTLSTGRAWGDTGWIIQASDLEKTVLRPPRGFSGAMQYTLTLRLADGRSADRQVLRLQWDQAANNGGSGREASPRQLDPDELATLLKRGEELFKTGDLAGARLLLKRAAEAHDPVGALALATTYDPNILTELGVRGVTGDAATARAWYEKAREYGSREAPKRLELLASQGR